MKDLSTDELAELRESFDTCDSNGDGWIIVGEFAALLHRSIRICRRTSACWHSR